MVIIKTITNKELNIFLEKTQNFKYNMKNNNIYAPVFLTSATLIFILVIIAMLFTSTFESIVNSIHEFITKYFGWYLILAVTLFLIFVIMLYFSRYRHIRLGPDNYAPDYSYFSWLAMLFSAGMGIGLLFYGVAEPLLHYANPPIDQEMSDVEAATKAMNYSFFHWGIHAWAVYIIIALSLAYFGYRKGFPLSIRYAFYPILGEKVKKWPGHIIDTLAVIGTLFGVATSLGLGAQQINSGIDFLMGVGESINIQVLLIIFITMIATISTVSGVDKGIKWLSIFNISAGGLLLLFVLIAGPTLYILQAFVQNTGYFFQNVIETSLWSNAFTNTDWQGDWTIFYWAWWIAWSPYVGMFIARISKGRTIGEFISGVLIVPSLLSFLWLTVFGGSAIHYEMSGSPGLIEIVQDNYSLAIFEFLELLPLTALISGFAILVIMSFFITSADSGSLVIHTMTAKDNTIPSIGQRIFWAFLVGIVSIALLLGGGLVALETATITLALPFSIVMFFICYTLYKALSKEDSIEDILVPSKNKLSSGTKNYNNVEE